ncbi:MAG: ATP-binding cassette domain-containing protein [Gammaproteobacteria bacterium]|nr:ATP-binding cassette domain-containing protein [Gammaproteobacteria bacterium]MYD75082.1 ATP-binding cassette domain-containing protein [Gammaproteobacteria bacterium]MYJ51520.1 ATP-binding cassette domain-containing protein [Gammaproteobacteria bacterium]
MSRASVAEGPDGRTPLLAVEGLKVHFPVLSGVLRRSVGTVRAVDGVSFTIHRGETLALVGESGCGKTTAGRAILGLVPATAGSIRFGDREIRGTPESAIRDIRPAMQMVFQDPQESLNPRMTVLDIIAEPLDEHRKGPKGARRGRVMKLLDAVGLARSVADRYPHEFSGGQRQRIGIARALALRPRLIVCDEPIAALDVSIQAQIVNLLDDLQNQFGLAYLFISHDLGMVRHVADRVAVMYLGRIIEVAFCDEIYGNPAHPYTRALLSAVPMPNPEVERHRQRMLLAGDVPSPSNPPSGCVFRTRCPFAYDRCRTDVPHLRPVESGHFAACHLSE